MAAQVTNTPFNILNSVNTIGRKGFESRNKIYSRLIHDTGYYIALRHNHDD